LTKIEKGSKIGTDRPKIVMKKSTYWTGSKLKKEGGGKKRLLDRGDSRHLMVEKNKKKGGRKKGVDGASKGAQPGRKQGRTIVKKVLPERERHIQRGGVTKKVRGERSTTERAKIEVYPEKDDVGGQKEGAGSTQCELMQS